MRVDKYSLQKNSSYEVYQIEIPVPKLAVRISCVTVQTQDEMHSEWPIINASNQICLKKKLPH